MDDNESFNKFYIGIIAIVIAVVVTASVVVPICLHFGSDPNAEEPIPYDNPGTIMTGFTYRDIGKTYEYTVASGTLNKGDVLVLIYDTATSLPSSNGYEWHSYVYNDWEFQDGSSTTSIGMYLNSTYPFQTSNKQYTMFDGVRVNVQNNGITTQTLKNGVWSDKSSVIPFSNVYAKDSNGKLNGISTFNYQDDIKLERESNVKLHIESGSFSELSHEDYVARCYQTINNGLTVTQGKKWAETDTYPYESCQVVESPVWTFDDEGYLISDGDTITLKHGEIEDEIPVTGTLVVGVLPTTVGLGNPDEVEGTAGLLIFILPVFIVLGILMAAIRLFKNDGEEEKVYDYER